MSIGDYVNWDKATEELLKASENNRRVLESVRLMLITLEHRLSHEMSEDKKTDLMLEKHEMTARIQLLEAEIKIFDNAWQSLCTEDRIILEELYTKCPRDKMAAVYNACDRLGCEQASIYRRKNEALKRFKKLIV
ncbi:MAG: hypothetical protein VB119_02965 [Candidatus Metalachnospira sp.]|nr:hypothetical protein [Candidatus Metalachnospira sp.]